MQECFNTWYMWLYAVEKVQCKSGNTFKDQSVESVKTERVQVVTLLKTKVLKVLILNNYKW